MAFLDKVLVVAGLSLVFVGCSDGAVGDKGVVRFSQMVKFVETDDFSKPLVLQKTVLVRLERAEGAVIRERGFPELSLEVTGGAAQVLPLGFAQYAVRLDEERTYRFLAKDGDVELDSISVAAKKGASARLHAKASVITTGTANARSCAETTQVDIDSLVLAPNQSAALVVVPLDADGTPMLGMLELTAKTGRDDVLLDTPLFFEGGNPNVLLVEPKNVATKELELEVKESSLGSFTTVVHFTSELAPVTCR